MATHLRGHRTLDTALQMNEAGAVTADAAWLVSSAAKILDLGDARFEGVVLMDISAMDIASTDEWYAIHIQGSTSATFASGVVNLATLLLGDASTIAAAAGGGADVDVDSTPGRYEIFFSNVMDSVAYRYIRGYTDVTGTTASINHVSYLCKL